MSKSLGNLVSVTEALERYSPDAMRLYFLSSHYRSPLAYSDAGAAAVERSLERVRHALTPGNGSGPQVDAAGHAARFTAAMDDDLNTPQAAAVLFDLARDLNRGRDAGNRIDAGQATLRELGAVLGLTFTERAGSAMEPAAAPFIDLLVSVRTELRAARQFALADQDPRRPGRPGHRAGGRPPGYAVAISQPRIGPASGITGRAKTSRQRAVRMMLYTAIVAAGAAIGALLAVHRCCSRRRPVPAGPADPTGCPARGAD